MLGIVSHPLSADRRPLWRYLPCIHGPCKWVWHAGWVYDLPAPMSVRCTSVCDHGRPMRRIWVAEMEPSMKDCA